MLLEKGHVVALQSVPKKSCFGNEGNLLPFLCTIICCFFFLNGEIYKFVHLEFLLSYPSLSLYFILRGS